MRLYIVRHGKSEEVSRTGRDEDRRLTGKGWRQARYLGAEIARAARPPEVILHSGLTRAFETASAIRDALDCPMQHERGLETDGALSNVITMLEGLKGVGSAMLVSHNPLVGELVSILLKGLPSGDACLMRTGDAVVIDIRLHQMVGTGRLIERLRLVETELGVGEMK